MNNNQQFSVICSSEKFGRGSDLHLFFQGFEEYNQSDKVKVLKQELSKIKICVKVDQQVIKLYVTNKTRGRYLQVLGIMRNIASIDFY